jgi:hypothetical protein
MKGRLTMKKIITAVLFSIAIAFSGTVGFANTVKANDHTYSYSFYNMNTHGNTGKESKSTNRKVYVHPISGPGLKYTVQGSATGSGWSNRSTQKTIYSGSKVRITNSVYQNGEPWVRLYYVRTTAAYTNTNGEWNPDPA